MEDVQLATLTDLWIAGVLSVGEQEELYLLLLSSPAAREQFDRQIACHKVLNPDLSLPSATEFLENYAPTASIVSLTLARGQVAPSEFRSDLAAIFRVSMRKWQYWSAGGALVACIIAALLGAAHSKIKPLRPFEVPANLSVGPVAKLRHAANVQWLGATNEIVVGDTFGAEELNIAAGVFQLDFKRGARLVVQGPARLQLVSDNEAFLHSGKVTAHVPNEAHGFKVTAPAMAVTDLGTEFGLRVASNAPVEVHVFSGSVDMAQPSVPPKRMTQGQAARVQGRSVKKFSVNRRDFVFEDDVQALESEEQRSQLEQWKNAARTFSRDSAALVHYTFEEQDEFSVRLMNAVPKAPRETIGALSGTWSTGRWPDKRAITFGSKADRIRFQVGNTMTSLTYMAWLRVDKLASVSNALAVTEGGNLGEVHWQIYRDGRVALSAHSGATGGVDQTWDRGLSPAVFTSERLGKWTHLTSVYDSAARTINHYLNGEFISSTPIKRPLPLKLGAVEIGNWGVRVDESRWASLKNSGPDYLNRHWSGCIDEFALLRRAMTPDEIRDYYRRGRIASGMTVAQNMP